MPNIEIHGYGFEENAADKMRTAVVKLFRKKDYIDEMVFTVCHHDKCFDKRGANQPFLRVVSTPSSHLDEIVGLLKTLNIDIEVLELKAFHPKQE